MGSLIRWLQSLTKVLRADGHEITRRLDLGGGLGHYL